MNAKNYTAFKRVDLSTLLASSSFLVSGLFMAQTWMDHERVRLAAEPRVPELAMAAWHEVSHWAGIPGRQVDVAGYAAPEEVPDVPDLPVLNAITVPDGPSGEAELQKIGATLAAAYVLPQEKVVVEIPRAKPAPEKAVTLSEEIGGTKERAGAAGYVLGEDGASPELRLAWSTLHRARMAEESDLQEPDEAYFRRAAGEIGYVPAGLAPEQVRSLDAPVEAGAGGLAEGPVTFRSADLLDVDGQLIRLDGVRAPSEEDACQTSEGSSYDCAGWAVRGMEMIVDGRELKCHLTDRAAGADGEVYGWCDLELRNGSRRDLAEIGVSSGILMVEHNGAGISPYLRSEDNAKNKAHGIWSGTYVPAKTEEEKE